MSRRFHTDCVGALTVLYKSLEEYLTVLKYGIEHLQEIPGTGADAVNSVTHELHNILDGVVQEPFLAMMLLATKRQWPEDVSPSKGDLDRATQVVAGLKQRLDAAKEAAK